MRSRARWGALCVAIAAAFAVPSALTVPAVGATTTTVTVYASDRTPTYAVNGWGPYERDHSNGEELAGDGGPIRIRGVTYAKGLGVHAASDLRYSNASCTHFDAVIGIDDEVAGGGSVVFQVFGDSTKLFDSGLLRGTSPARTVSLDTSSRQQLRLVVTAGLDGNGNDHADWADAKLTCNAPVVDSTPPTVVSVTPADGAVGVLTNVVPTATFSEPMTPGTVTSASVGMVALPAGTPVAATVTYDATNKRAVLTPSAALAPATTYRVTVRGGSSGVADLAGNRLAQDRVLLFTTNTTLFVSDLAPTSATNGWGPYERDHSNGEDAAGDGGPIRIRGVTYAKGLGVHAVSDLRYSVATCHRFDAVVGVDDEVAGHGSVVFQVFGDGVKLYDSGIVTGTSAARIVSLDITNRSELRLLVGSGVDGNGNDHADWANARITCDSNPPQPIDATPPAVTLTSPGSGATVNDTTPTFIGKAGLEYGDVQQVNVLVYAGVSPTGAVLETASIIPDKLGAWAVDVSPDLPLGQYTARAEQHDLSGNLGRSAAVTFTIGAPAAQPADDPVLLAAGDVATCSSLGDEATAALLDGQPGTIAMLGDAAYDSGTDAEFANCYNPSWGRHKARTRPVPGNHDYITANAGGYFRYFAAAAGDPTKGYYSYDLGAWHIVAINSNCLAIGGCVKGSPEDVWLRADLAAHPARCTLAYFHHPLFSYESGALATKPIWQALDDYGVDVILGGHVHGYERSAAQDADGFMDQRAISQFIVGTGGAPLEPYGGPALPNSEVRQNTTLGVLQLKLHATSYEWSFLNASGPSFTDVGSRACH